MRHLLAILACILATGQVASAGTIGMSSAPGQLEPTGIIPPFVVTSIYVVVDAPPSQINGIEYGIAHGSEAVVVGASYDPSLPLCVVCPPWDDYISGFGACYERGPTWTFATIDLMVFAGVSDLSFCVRPLSNSSFEPPSPGVSTCDAGLLPLELNGGPYPPPGCVLLNPTGVATAKGSWSALKGRFRERD